MASNMMENLQAIVQNTAADSIKMIDVDELHESPDNFFAIEHIEELADTILGQGGVKDNLIVRPLKSGGYEIISGHRRRAAVQHLLDRGENISRYLPCLVQNYTDEDSRLLDIVLMNVSARQISDTEMWQSYELLNRILQNKKSSGEKFGRIRDKLAEILGVSAAQIGKMENVAHNAIPEVLEAVQSGEISISTANEIAKLDFEDQEEIVKQGDLQEIKPKEIKKKAAPKKSATSSTISEDKDEPEICATSSTISEDEDEPEVCATSSTISEDEDEPEICATSSTFSEDEDEPEVCATSSTNQATEKLTHFIHEHYYDLETIFTTYTSMADDEEEIRLLEDFQELLRQSKEAERNKVRFGL